MFSPFDEGFVMYRYIKPGKDLLILIKSKPEYAVYLIFENAFCALQGFLFLFSITINFRSGFTLPDSVMLISRLSELWPRNQGLLGNRDFAEAIDASKGKVFGNHYVRFTCSETNPRSSILTVWLFLLTKSQTFS